MAMNSRERMQLIREITEHPSWKQHTEMPLGRPVLYKKQLAAALLELADALEEVQLKPYSFFIWTRLGKDTLTIKTGPNDSAGIHVVENLGEFITILRIRAEHLDNAGNDPTIAGVLVSTIVFELVEQKIRKEMGPDYRLRELRDLLELGAEIWVVGTAPVGFFILLEIYQIIPDTPIELDAAISCIREFIEPVLPSITSDDLKKASPLLEVMRSSNPAVDAYLALPKPLRQELQNGVLDTARRSA